MAEESAIGMYAVMNRISEESVRNIAIWYADYNKNNPPIRIVND